MSKNHCRKATEIEHRRVWNFTQLENIEFCLNGKVFMKTLKRKLNELFKGNVQLRKDYLRQSEIDRGEWERRNADIALYETTRHLESQRVEPYQANQCADQAQREKSWLLGELDTRNKRLSGRSRKRLRNNWRITKNLQARSWKSSSIEVWWVLHATERENFYSESAFGSDSGIARQCEFLERCTRIRWSWNSEQHWIIACSLIHGNHSVHQETLEGLLRTYWVPQETFLKIYLLDTAIFSILVKPKEFGSSFLRIEPNWYRQNCWTNQRIEKNCRIVQYQLLDLPGVMEPGILFFALEELIIKIVRWKIREIGARTCILIFSLTPKTSSVGRSISRLKYPLTEDVLQSQCYGSKKWR